MPIAPRRSRTEEDARSPRPIALMKAGGVAAFRRRPSVLSLGDRRPARRLGDPGNVPAVSRIVLRPLTLR
jgi:hypothetical protein